MYLDQLPEPVGTEPTELSLHTNDEARLIECRLLRQLKLRRAGPNWPTGAHSCLLLGRHICAASEEIKLCLPYQLYRAYEIQVIPAQKTGVPAPEVMVQKLRMQRTGLSLLQGLKAKGIPASLKTCRGSRYVTLEVFMLAPHLIANLAAISQATRHALSAWLKGEPHFRWRALLAAASNVTGCIKLSFRAEHTTIQAHTNRACCLLDVLSR